MSNKFISLLRSRISSNQFNSGQAIVLIVLASIGLIAMMGLSIDGGRLLYLNRRTQNATDAAVLAAAKSMCSGQTIPEFQAAGLNAAKANGFENDGTNTVAINVPPTSSSITIGPECTGCYVESVVTGHIPGTFISMFYKGQLASTSKAIAACNPNKNGDEADAYGQRAIWAIAPAGSCNPAEVKINASDLTIDGGIHTNGDLQIEGGGNNDNVVSGPTSHVGDVKTNEDKFTFLADGGDVPGPDGTTTAGNCRASCFQDPASVDPNACKAEFYPATNPFQVCQPKPDPMASLYKIADYAYTPGPPETWGSVANAENLTGHYFPYVSNQCNGQHSFANWMVDQGHMVGNVIVHPGLYYTTCPISLTGVTGTASFVSTENISISGGFNLTAYLSNKLLFYTTVGQNPNGTGTCNGVTGINLSGPGNTYTGDIYAPYSAVSFSAADNMTANGCVTAWQVDFQGSHSSLTCVRSDPSWTPEPVFWLPE